MPLCVVHICGPRRCGKTRLAGCIARKLGDRPHHLRMVKWDGRGSEDFMAVTPMDAMFESRRCNYMPERIFEQLPGALRAIKQTRRWATVLLETDADPCHRQAYEYDVRVFVAPAPSSADEVFRTAGEATQLMNAILEDTAMFAQEIYGLAPDEMLDESRVGECAMAESSAGGTWLSKAMTESDMGRLMTSSMGRDLACRLQFQPDYYPVVDSDVVILNTACGSCGPTVDEVARRVEDIQSRLDRPSGREAVLAVCDLTDDSDPSTISAVSRLIGLVAATTSKWP